jgi:hypothetical protein
MRSFRGVFSWAEFEILTVGGEHGQITSIENENRIPGLRKASLVFDSMVANWLAHFQEKKERNDGRH